MCFMSTVNDSWPTAQCYGVEHLSAGSDYIYKVHINTQSGVDAEGMHNLMTQIHSRSFKLHSKSITCPVGCP